MKKNINEELINKALAIVEARGGQFLYEEDLPEMFVGVEPVNDPYVRVWDTDAQEFGFTFRVCEEYPSFAL